LLQDAEAIRADRRSNREFVLPLRRSHEQEVGDIDARDQQHEPNGTEEQQERCPRSPGEVVYERHDRDSDARVARILGRDLSRDRVERGAAGRDVDPWL
jgi:hypothetical protein